MIQELTLQRLKEYTSRKIQSATPPVCSEWILCADDLFDSGSDIFISLHSMEANKPGGGLHGHDFFELNYVIHGTMHQILGEGTFNSYPEGTVCIMNPNIRHDIYVDSADDLVLNIGLKKSLFTSTFWSMIQQHEHLGQFFLNYFLAQERSSDYLLFDLKPTVSLEQALDFLCMEYLEKKPFNQLTMRCMLVIFFTELIRNFNQQISSRKFTSKTNTQIIALFNYLSVNYSTATLESTADYFHYHPNYLSTFIKKHTGKTFRSILNDIKLSQATYYLQNTNMPIKEIAESLGFTQLCNFYDFIKRNCGTTPVKFRQKDSFQI